MSERERPMDVDGPSEKAVRNVKLAVLQLLAAEDQDLLAALHACAPAPAAAALGDLRARLLDLLTADVAVRQAVTALVASNHQPVVLPVLGGSDAEHAQHVVDLIEEKMRQTLRPDAFRRPTFAR